MRYIIILVLVLVFISVSVVNAQSDQCSTILEAAIAEANENCANIESNTACYGTGTVDVFLFDDSTTNTDFSNPSDTISLDDISEIATSPLNLDTGEIGIVIMNLPLASANVESEDALVLVLIGDIALEYLGLDEAGIPNLFLYRGAGSPSCSAVPNGLMVQTPKGNQVTLNRVVAR